jgi:hypothetical protein
MQYLVESEWLEANIKMIPLYFSLSGVFLAYYHYLFTFKILFLVKKTQIGRNFYTFLNRK